jgi:hypothetical protein
MRRSIIVLALAVIMVMSMTGAALAGNGKDHGTYAFGKGVSVHCDASYGQLVKAAKQSGHVTGPVSGVKSFVESGLFAAHCL